MISREIIQWGFPIKPLGEVAEFLDSRRRPITASERIPGPYPYYGANGQQDSVADYIFDEPLILLAEDGGQFDHPDRGIAYAIEGKTWVNNHAHVLRPRDHAHPRYLVRVLENYDVTPWITGSTRAKLTKAGAFKIQIPLPPLAEQKRIAGILDAADALRAKRREALAQLDTLLQATFLDMFGDPATNPMGWTKVRSGELFLLPPKIGTITPAAGRGYLVVRVGEVGESRIAFERCRRVEISEQDFAKFRLERGDTVIARAIGSKNHLGKASFFAGFDEATVIDSHVMRLRPDPIKCDGLWFYSLISSDRGKVLLQQTGRATAVQFNINAKQASSVQVALPPLDLQHHFAAIAESVECQKASQRAHLAELDTLYASLQSRAFRGDL